ncbi:MAG: serine/threonine protein kinase [Planctomycetes bacterium]|nr:serine/threonine protein kinase [Planctomycetota bacterium]
MAESVLRCAGCNVRFRVKSYDPERKYTCPKCKGALKPESSATAAPDAQSLPPKEEMVPEPSPDSLVGQRVAHYQILKKLGQGGMGAVYQAENLNLKRIVALKILPPDLATANPQFAQRFLREAQSQAALEHPNVVPIYHVGRHETYYFIEMQFVGGGSVAGLMKKPMPTDQATAILRGAAQGLAAAHKKKLIHRDIKPENILLTEDGMAKVSDFGLAKAVDVHSGLTASGQVLGTPFYMSPEQSRGVALDARSDIYSLGVTFYQMLTGERPFMGDSAMAILYHHCCTPPKNPRELRPEISESLAAVCLNAMLKDPANRYQGMEEFVADLDKAASGQPVAIRAIEEIKGPGKVVTKRPQAAKPTPAPPAPPVEATAESARLEDVIDQAEEQDHYLRTRRVERRLKEVQAFLLVWSRFAELLEAGRAGKVGKDFESVRDTVARGYGKIMPRLDQAKTMGSRVVAAAKTGVMPDDVKALPEEDFARLQRHCEGGRALLTEYVNFLEAGRQALLRQSPLRYYWAKFLHNRVAWATTLAAGVVLACVIGWQVAKRLPERKTTDHRPLATDQQPAPSADHRATRSGSRNHTPRPICGVCETCGEAPARLRECLHAARRRQGPIRQPGGRTGRKPTRSSDRLAVRNLAQGAADGAGADPRRRVHDGERAQRGGDPSPIPEGRARGNDPRRASAAPGASHASVLHGEVRGYAKPVAVCTGVAHRPRQAGQPPKPHG